MYVEITNESSLEQIENILKIQIKPLEACDMYDKTKPELFM